jgi:hypothetical protein
MLQGVCGGVGLRGWNFVDHVACGDPVFSNCDQRDIANHELVSGVLSSRGVVFPSGKYLTAASARCVAFFLLLSLKIM